MSLKIRIQCNQELYQQEIRDDLLVNIEIQRTRAAGNDSIRYYIICKRPLGIKSPQECRQENRRTFASSVADRH
jgi:hypothetical protein